MGKLTIHPPGTPLKPDHPFATPQILFVPKHSLPHGGDVESPASCGGAERAIEANVNAGPIEHWDKLLRNFDDRLRASGRTVTVEESSREDEFIASFPVRAAIERLPLIPQLPPDLEDIAFEILRLHYTGRK